MEIEIEKGKIVLREPLAGERNEAMANAVNPETGVQNNVRMMIELLPYCVKSHPFGTVPVKQALASLSISEYDKVVEGFSVIMNPETLKKKLD